MFGYITVNQDELKGKDLRKYKEFYCGVCRDIKKHSGQFPRVFLTYDMAFLAILLSSLNDEAEDRKEAVCSLHPLKKTVSIQNRWTEYAADMNVLLTYHNLMDDWIDEKKLNSRAAAGILSAPYRKLVVRYPKQVQAIETYLEALHRVEKEQSGDIDKAAGLTGILMAELFSRPEVIWKEEMKTIGFYMGKWIYLMDAWNDVEKDREKGNYNPFAGMADDPDFDEKAHQILMMMAAEAARAFERLPIVENVDILRNILYSGIWNTYRKIQKEKKSKK
ncbi:MAG: DUF5685 family protein [Lachnospiraceae bacterium]|nr:DUF5685 family protein [Lachnospiraceae bacterium]